MMVILIYLRSSLLDGGMSFIIIMLQCFLQASLLWYYHKENGFLFFIFSQYCQVIERCRKNSFAFFCSNFFGLGSVRKDAEELVAARQGHEHVHTHKVVVDRCDLGGIPRPDDPGQRHG